MMRSWAFQLSVKLANICAIIVPLPSFGSAYKLNTTYDASNFFMTFEFRTSADGNWNDGFANFVDQEQAQKEGLAVVKHGKVYLGTDNETELLSWSSTTAGRKSIRIESKDTWDSGLLIADFGHMPGNACGMWPSFFLLHDYYPKSEPWFSELEVIEGISLYTHNEFAMYTYPTPCQMSEGPSTANNLHTDCFSPLKNLARDVEVSGKPGCKGIAPEGTFGDEFNNKDGGVWALQLESEGLKIWYWARSDIPDDVRNGMPDPSNWRMPVLHFGSGSCNIAEAWKKMRIVLTTTFCGTYAGHGWRTYSNCSAITGVQQCREYVAKNPKAFSEVYWAINYIKTFRRGPEAD